MKKTFFKSCTIAALSAVILAGCSSKDDVSASNFKSVISNYYVNHDAPATCIASELDSFPYQMPRHPISMGDVSLEDKISALADAGLIQQVGPIRFNLTDTGKSTFISNKGFCFGTIEVAEVTNFTEPAQESGQTISRVNYTVDVVDRPEWSETPQLVDAFHLSDDGLITLAYLMRNDHPEKRSMVLIKTNNGWVTQHDMNENR